MSVKSGLISFTSPRTATIFASSLSIPAPKPLVSDDVPESDEVRIGQIGQGIQGNHILWVQFLQKGHRNYLLNKNRVIVANTFQGDQCLAQFSIASG